MSYDIDIRKDRTYSQATDLPTLRRFISALPNIIVEDDIRLTLEDNNNCYMELYLAYFDIVEQGYILDENIFREQGRVNCINCHIPYGHMSNKTLPTYKQTITLIADFLQWEAYDHQRDIDFRFVTHY